MHDVRAANGRNNVVLFYDVKIRLSHCWVKSSVTRLQNQLQSYARFNLEIKAAGVNLYFVADARHYKFRNK